MDGEGGLGEVLGQFRVVRKVLQRLADHVEETEENGKLQDQREAAPERVHPVLLVELHHLFVQLLAIALVLLL